MLGVVKRRFSGSWRVKREEGRSIVGQRIARNRIAYLFILPAALGMLFVHYLPMLWGILISFRDVNLFTIRNWSQAPFVGVANFALGFDPAGTLGARFWRSLWNITVFGAVTILVGYALGMVVAHLLNRRFPGRALVRGLILLPYITPDSVAYSVWRFIFQARIGLVNKWLLALGLIDEPQIWLVGSKALTAVTVAGLWKGWPFAALILLAGLQSIPQEYYEAARIDGAGGWARFRHVTFPLLAPVTRTYMLMSILWNYNAFNQFRVMLGTDPGVAADVPSTLIMREAFDGFNFGVGSAMSLALMLLMLVVALLFLKTSSRREGVE